MSVDNSNNDDNGEADGLASRDVALALLSYVLDKKQAFDHVLEAHEGFHALDTKDKAFVRMMVSTILRRLGQIDDLIAQLEDRQTTKTFMLQNILRLGVVQIMFMAVADHAAVDTAVRLCEKHGHTRQKGFVNAVLRNVTRSGPALMSKQDEARLNTPEWLLKTWIADYGLGVAAEIARANLNEAPLDITIKDEKDRNHYASLFKATELLTGSLRKSTGGRVQELEGFEEGAWWVQDASAAIPAQLFGDINGEVVIDLCAAPGGKSVQLASRGADVVALDRSAKRLARVDENAARLGFSEKIEIHVADAAAWKPPGAVLRYILLDAPCSATGTVRRHPDVLHLKREQDVTRLADTQARILDNAFEILAVGGVLVYCVCSLQKDEGERRIEAFLAQQPQAARMPITPEDLNGYSESINEDGDLRILPHHQSAIGGMDGFYIARLTKVA